MASLKKAVSSLLWLAALSSAQFTSVARPFQTRLPNRILRPSLTDDPPPAARTIVTFTVDENGVRQRREPLTTMIPPSTPTGTVPPEELPQPTMYNLNSSDADRGEPPVGYFQVEAQGGVSIEQAIVFRGIPIGARLCKLMWRQAGSAERCFSVGGHGITAVRQLSGFPGENEPVTFNSLRAFDGDNATTFSPDFSFWPDHDGPFKHLAGAITCSEEIYLRIALNRSYGDGFIYLDQDEKNGFYIQYTL
ncbi:hypothetical protein DL766_006244 [Monosporascus sp. MC13-8B]|uniref:Ubiquitin 3 binding protein But2 C-terminal domain-containing protein n=1 Tax=Monosporascus cannonballus TaxID=155416 RepID=A0ABY0H6D4_9PEZI|nr:hypothetical protein DL762_006422 [Monosporascus cannonballus]RYO91193.1 hypothetical protein DL763_005063 [Monosporascus cannonballus]RYP27744.1 hypothetical protein DL766_006244 [Monosporascus sp. MC13-8B]